LRKNQGELAKYIYEQLPIETKSLLENCNFGECPSREILSTLVHELNKLLIDATFFNEKRFENIKLDESTTRMIRKDLQCEALFSLNRMLLSEAFPDEISPIESDKFCRWEQAHRCCL
jgi:hypothetical protein